MAFVLNDRVLETTITTGTGPLALDGAPSGYQTFNEGVGTSNTTFYAIFNTVAAEWELGLGTVSSSSVLTRTTVYSSSNADAAVNFSAGTKNVFVTLPAGKLDGTVIGGVDPSTGAFTDLTLTSGQLTVPLSNPSAASAGTYDLFARSVGGRIMPAFIGPSALDSVLQPHIARNKIAHVSAAGNSTTITNVGTATLTATGTATAANVATTNIYTRMRLLEYLVTTAATTAVAGFTQPAAQYTLGGSSAFAGFHLVVRFGPSTGVTTGTRRLFVGMTNSTSAPTDVNPSTLVNMVGVGYDAADTNMQIMHNDASGTATKIDLGASFPRPAADRSKMYELVLFSPPNGGSEINYSVTDLGTGAIASGTIISADVPAVTTLLAARGYSSVGGTSSVTGIALSSLYIETDY
jgi:hypothetical protein